MTCIIIPVFNRLPYLNECIEHLKMAILSYDIHVLFIDDCSTQDGIQDALIQACNTMDNAAHLRNNTNLGIRLTIKRGAEMAFNALNCDNAMVLDCDVIIKSDFMLKLLKLQVNTGLMVSGINCTQLNERNQVRNPVISEHADYFIKSAVAGQCLLFSKEKYYKYVLPALLMEGNWDHNASIASMKDGYGIAVCKPSVCQHIGMFSAMGHHSAPPDFADDYKRLSLPDVTLFGIDSFDKAGITRAAYMSMRDIEYEAVNIITDDLFTKNGSTEVRRRDYSRFMLKELANQFTTSHVLTIHADGYVLDFKAWDKEWLQYDYIGATWAYKDNMNVGNGGFSLRSKRLCEILASQDIPDELMHPEDGCICRTFRHSLENDFGIRFAPEEVANRFSIEAYGSSGFYPPTNGYSGQFGFHGVHVDFNNTNVSEFMRWPLPKNKQQVIIQKQIIRR